MRNLIPRLPWQDIIDGQIQDPDSSFGALPEPAKETMKVDPNSPTIIRIYNEAMENMDKHMKASS